MNLAVFKTMLSLLRPTRLTGPIFEKELRVASRRRRNYLLRFAYVAMLGLFVLGVWAAFTRSGRDDPTFVVSRMSVAGKAITATIANTQFWILQLVAIVLLSTAVSDEIDHKTLGVLMSTPITSFQIVMGKLFSRLLQLVLLLAISIPMLAVTRIFGGVPWDYLVSSACITLTALVFTGSLTIGCSIRSRKAFWAILQAIVIMVVLFGVIPAIIALLLMRNIAPQTAQDAFGLMMLCNPFAAMSYNTALMSAPVRGGLWFSWPVHCLIMLGASALILAECTRKVRRVALRQACGDISLSRAQRRRLAAPPPAGAGVLADETVGRLPAIRPIRGSPVLWRELRGQVLKRKGRITMLIAILTCLAGLAISYCVCARDEVLDSEAAHVIYVELFLLSGLLIAAVLPAASITSEKESLTWPLLLATPLEDWDILWGKAAAAFRRCLPVWLFLVGHLLLFTLLGYIHPIALLHMSMLLAGITGFLIGSGLFFSARFRRTTTAVVVNMCLALFLWAIIPAIIPIMLISSGESGWELYRMLLFLNPMALSSMLITGAVRGSAYAAGGLKYRWLAESLSAAQMTGVVVLVAVLYLFAGLVFLRMGKNVLRWNVF